MSKQRLIWLAATLFSLAIVLVTTSPTRPGDNKDGGDEKKSPVILDMTEKLAPSDERDAHPMSKKSPYKAYKLKFSGGQYYQIDVSSNDFDAVARLETAAGKELAACDDAFTPPSRDARIVYKPEQTVDVKVIATAAVASPTKIGRFSITVTEVGKFATASVFKTKPIPLALTGGKTSHAGELTKEDGAVLEHYFKVLAVPFEAGKSYRVDLKSKSFDSYLKLEDPFGNLLTENDDADGKTNNSSVTHKATMDGPHRIVATTFPRGHTGKFTLDIAEVAEGKAKDADKDKTKDKDATKDKSKDKDADKDKGADKDKTKDKDADKDKSKDKDGDKDKTKDKKASADAGSFIAFQDTGKRGSGKDPILRKAEALTADDPRDAKMKKSYCKIYKVNLTEGQVYRIDLSSREFDTYLRVEDAAGKELAFNDDIELPKNLNSRLVYVAPKTAEYRVIVTTYKAGDVGDFTLEVAQASDAEAAEARLLHRIETYGDAAAPERRKLVAELTKQFADKGKKLEFKDAQLAAQLSMVVDEDGAESAKETCNALVKIFADAEDKRVASVAKFIASNIPKLDLLGKEMAIAGKTVSGKEFDLKNLKGKVVLVDFWATWCAPCIAELPNMENAYKKYQAQGFDIVGISLDRPGDDEKLAKFIEARKMPWPSINIADSRPLAVTYKVNSIPFPVLVDREGRVVSFRARGPHLERLLERLLAEKK